MKEAGDKYRSFLHDEAKNIEWRHGGPPIYDAVNKLFDEGRTKVSLYLSIYLSIGVKDIIFFYVLLSLVFYCNLVCSLLTNFFYWKKYSYICI